MTTYKAVGTNWAAPGRPNKPSSAAPSVPAAPVSFTATATTSTSVGLAWTPAALPVGATPVTGYRIYLNGVAVATLGLTTSYTRTGLAAATSYAFRVSALNSIGGSPLSATQTVTTSAAVSAVPNAPAALNGTVLSDTSVSLNWTAATLPTGASAVTGYKVYRGAGTLVATLGNVLSTTLTGLTAGTTYGFYLTSQNATGPSTASPTKTLTTTDSSVNTVITPLPSQPGGIAFADHPDTQAVDISAFYHPGAMLVVGRLGIDDQRMKDFAAAGGHLLVYLDAIIDASYGRYHDKLLNASEFGPAVPLWPGNPVANEWGNLNDFRVGGILQSKLEGVLELIVTENPHIAGFFADDLGTRSWYAGFSWDNWGNTYQQAYRDGAIGLAQTFRTVCDRHGLFFLVNGTWAAGTLAQSGGGYPDMTKQGCSLAEGGVVEHHDGQVAYFGGYAAATGQWGDASPITGHGKPLCFAIMETAAGVTEFRNAGTYAWITQQGSYANPPAPWGPFHPTGLPSSADN